MYFYVIIKNKKISKKYILRNSHGYHFQLLGNPFQHNGFRWRYGDVGIGGGGSKVIDGFGEGLVREGCRGFPVVTNKSIYFHDFDYISYCSGSFEVVRSS